MNKHLIPAILLTLVLSGCAAWQRVDTAQTEAPDKSYTVELPVGWVRLMQQVEGIAVTRDGFALNNIHVRRLDLDKAFPKLKKAASADMLPSELAEAQIAELKRLADDMVVTVKANGPALIGGQTGYRVLVQYRNKRGLILDELIYGCATSKGYFVLSYEAPALHYSPRDLPIFEKVVASFKLAAG